MGAPAVPPMVLLAAAIAVPAIKPGAGRVPVGGPAGAEDPGKLEGPGIAIGTTLAARGVLLLGLLGRRA